MVDEPMGYGHPAWRRVFRTVIELADATEALNKLLPDRKVTPVDEVGYTLGKFCKNVICKRNRAKMRELLAAFKRGLGNE